MGNKFLLFFQEDPAFSGLMRHYVWMVQGKQDFSIYFIVSLPSCIILR